MKTIGILIAVMVAFCVVVSAVDIIPAKKWPRVIERSDKQIVNPSVDECLAAGYRLLLDDKPATPAGKKIKSETIIQDPIDRTKCKHEVVYEALPTPTPTPTPKACAWVESTNVQFFFTSDGIFAGMIRLKSEAK